MNFTNDNKSRLVQISYNGFNDFSEIHLECDLYIIRNKVKQSKSFIYNTPLKYTPIRKTIDLDSIGLYQNESINGYQFMNIKGFHLEAVQLFNISRQQIIEFVSIRNSMLNFFFNEKLLDENECDFNKLNSRDIHLFANLDKINRLTLSYNVIYVNSVLTYSRIRKLICQLLIN